MLQYNTAWSMLYLSPYPHFSLFCTWNLPVTPRNLVHLLHLCCTRIFKQSRHGITQLSNIMRAAGRFAAPQGTSLSIVPPARRHETKIGSSFCMLPVAATQQLTLRRAAATCMACMPPGAPVSSAAMSDAEAAYTWSGADEYSRLDDRKASYRTSPTGHCLESAQPCNHSERNDSGASTRTVVLIFLHNSTPHKFQSLWRTNMLTMTSWLL